MVNANLLTGRSFHIFPTHRSREKQVFDLVDLIEIHGGTVKDLHESHIDDVDLAAADNEDEVYALIDPSQPWAPRFFERRMRQDALDASTIYFLNWGYPQLCVEEDELVDVEDAREKLIFTQTAAADGGWSFYFSPTLLRDKIRVKRYSAEIIDHGGRVATRERDATIVIAGSDELDDERERFVNNSFTRVESRGWFKDTLENVKYVRFTAPARKPMPGRIPARDGGRTRRAYAQEDKDFLVKYLAVHSSETGQGRSGNNIYIDLVERGNTDPEWKERWPRADGHSWQSWRNQYKKNIKYYERGIEDYLARLDLPFLDGHGHDPRSRENNRHRIISRKRLDPDSGEESEWEVPDSEEEKSEPVRHKKRRRPRMVEDNADEEVQVQVPNEGDAEGGSEEEEDELAGDKSDVEPMAYDNNIGTQEFEAFDEEIPQMPTSTPPRASPANFNSSRSTLVGAASSGVVSGLQGKLAIMLSKVPRASPAASSVVSRTEGKFGIPDDEADEPNEDKDGEGLSAVAESDDDNGSQMSVDDASEENEDNLPEPTIPPLDMEQERQKFLHQKRSHRARRAASPMQDVQERERGSNASDSGLQARSFRVSGSTRKSNGTVGENPSPTYMTRSQPAKRALRSAGIFPSSQHTKRTTTKK